MSKAVVKRKRSVSPTALSSVPGVIERIQLENFMCHEELDWQPNRNVNFIMGVNGSGKSSILQGLVLGLLADSKATKRYSRLQDFVKKGCTKAVIKVSLLFELLVEFLINAILDNPEKLWRRRIQKRSLWGFYSLSEDYQRKRKQLLPDQRRAEQNYQEYNKRGQRRG